MAYWVDKLACMTNVDPVQHTRPLSLNLVYTGYCSTDKSLYRTSTKEMGLKLFKENPYWGKGSGVTNKSVRKFSVYEISRVEFLKQKMTSFHCGG